MRLVGVLIGDLIDDFINTRMVLFQLFILKELLSINNMTVFIFLRLLDMRFALYMISLKYELGCGLYSILLKETFF